MKVLADGFEHVSNADVMLVHQSGQLNKTPVAIRSLIPTSHAVGHESVPTGLQLNDIDPNIWQPSMRNRINTCADPARKLG